TYWLQPDGTAGRVAPFQDYCQMSNTAGDPAGGWTLIASTIIPTNTTPGVMSYLGLLPFVNSSSAVYDTTWVTSLPYPDLTTLRPGRPNMGLVNLIPFNQLTAFRFT